MNNIAIAAVDRRVWLTWIGYVTLVLMNILDVFYTEWALSVGVTEGNPLMDFFLQKYGMLGIIGYKTVFLLSLLLFIRSIYTSIWSSSFFLILIGAHVLLTIYHVTMFLVVNSLPLHIMPTWW